jgi:hypothetical protein
LIQSRPISAGLSLIQPGHLLTEIYAFLCLHGLERSPLFERDDCEQSDGEKASAAGRTAPAFYRMARVPLPIDAEFIAQELQEHALNSFVMDGLSQRQPAVEGRDRASGFQ